VTLDPALLLPVAVAAFFVGFLKATFGLAVGTLLVPVMVLFWPTRLVFGVIGVQMWMSDYFAIRLFWGKWDARLVKLVIPGFIAGILIGATLLVRLPDYWMRKSLGVVCLVLCGLQALQELRGIGTPSRIGPWAGTGIGIAGGVVSAMFHAGGLIMNLYILSQGVAKVPLVATTIATWIFVNPVKLTSYWVGGVINLKIFLTGLLAAPLTFSGLWLGKRVLEWAPQRAYNLTLLVLSALAALRLLAE
jgi:hypothetical protein